MTKRKIKVYDELDLLETSVVGIPSYPDATLSFVGIRKDDEKMTEEVPSEEEIPEPEDVLEQEEENMETEPEKKADADLAKQITEMEQIKNDLKEIAEIKKAIAELTKEFISKSEVEKKGLVEVKKEVSAPVITKSFSKEMMYDRKEYENWMDGVVKMWLDTGLFRR